MHEKPRNPVLNKEMIIWYRYEGKNALKNENIGFRIRLQRLQL
jgi:hypothetical protein